MAGDAEFGVVKGKRLRATLVDSCGMPLAGPRSRLVTNGFVTATLSPQMREAEDIEQTNADGAICVADRNKAERKWWNAALELCKVSTALYNMLLDWELVTSFDGKPIGFSDRKTQPDNRGVALELWTGVGADDECTDIPTTDDILVGGAGAGITKYGYVLLGVVKEFALSGDLQIGAQVSTFSLTGRTSSPVRWGRGPYNVVAIDSSNTAGRMLAPMKPGQHLRIFETTIAPPEPTDGACPLVLPSPYYGETAAQIAPSQPPCDAVGTNEIQTVTLTGTPTGGTFNLAFQADSTTALPFDATPTAVQAALEALPSIGEDNVTVTGSAGGPYTVTFVGALAGMNLPLLVGTDNLTGGTNPGVTVVETQQGGIY
ncbi:hypothetical protein [Nocardia farcinica]|uniref:hypothetical protein n=1 Tax=Nocardia farcinica TaxID=37329 RepID=UPI0015F0C5EC|nr:hypothetical protein [Nocardia farcinica]MBA4858068.1 hypothetical protein [Nocardia farcinica]MBC9819401.1 hypothetical protein [Nocardia farcinica]